LKKERENAKTNRGRFVGIESPNLKNSGVRKQRKPSYPPTSRFSSTNSTELAGSKFIASESYGGGGYNYSSDEEVSMREKEKRNERRRKKRRDRKKSHQKTGESNSLSPRASNDDLTDPDSSEPPRYR